MKIAIREKRCQVTGYVLIFFRWNRRLQFVLGICCKPMFFSKIAQKGKNCSELLKPQKLAPNAKTCSKVAEYDRNKPTHVSSRLTDFSFLHCHLYCLADVFTLWRRNKGPHLLSWQLGLPWRTLHHVNLCLWDKILRRLQAMMMLSSFLAHFASVSIENIKKIPRLSFSDASWKSLENSVFQWFSSRYIRHGDPVSCDQSQANKQYTGTINFIHSWWIWDFSYIFHADWLMRVLYHWLQFKLSLRREWDQ